jgi:hypothetical protein
VRNHVQLVDIDHVSDEHPNLTSAIRNVASGHTFVPGCPSHSGTKSSSTEHD